MGPAYRTACIIIIVLCFLFTPVVSLSFPFQNPSQWVRFSTDEGLPSNRVLDVAEAPNGTVWALTSSGLAFYNGYFWTPVGKPLGLHQKQINSFFIDSTGRVLALSNGNIYIGNERGFTLHKLLLHQKQLLVMELAQYNNNKFLAIHEDFSLHVWDYNFSHATPFTQLQHSGSVRKVWNTRSGNIWIATDKGVYSLRDSVLTKQIETPSFGLTVTTLAEDTLTGGIMGVIYPAEQRGLWEWKPNEPPRHSKEGRIDFIQSLDVLDKAHPLYSYMSGEIRVQVENSWNSLENLPEQLINILFLKYRTSGGLWVGTESGLFLYTTTTALWNYWKKPQVSRSNRISELLSAHDGSFWIATDEGIEIRKPDGSTENITTIAGSRALSLTGLAEDEQGNIWVSSGSSFEGAYRWDGSQWKHFGRNEGLSGFFHKIKKDKKNRLWFLGMAKYYADEKNEPGAFLFENGKFSQWSTKQGLINNRVYAFAEGTDGALWFGTSGGISRRKDGSWKHWTMNEGLRQNRTFTLALDHQNTLWFSDQMTGLGYLKDDAPHYFTVADGLISDVIWEIHIDSLSRIWIATANGLSCYNNGIWSRFDATTGLNPLRLWPLLQVGNKLFVGTMGGGTAILNLDHANKLPPVAIIEQPARVNNSFHLKWNAYSFWGELPSKKIETRYRLDEHSWSTWSMEHQQMFVDLRPGNHTFAVQAKGLFGNFSAEGYSFTFAVDSPYYLKPLFYVPIITLATVLFIFGFIYNRRKRKQDILLKLNEERYRAIVHDQTEFIIRFSPDGKLTFVNDAFSRMVNQEPENLKDKNLYEVVFPSIKKILQHHVEALKILKPENPTSSLELELLFPTGEIRWQSWVDRAIFDNNETLIEVQSVGRDITKQKLAELGLYRREAILEALSFATEHFMQGESFKQSVQNILARLGKATAVSRVYIFENHVGENNTLLTSQKFEWVSAETEPQIDNPELQNLPLMEAGFERWIKLLSSDNYVYGHIREFPQSERDILQQQQIRSICVVPISVNHQWWGFIGFDDCYTERDWSFAELEALKSAANIFGTAIERKEREKTVNMLAHAIKSIGECVSITDNENYILFVNDAFLKTYGYTSEELIGQNISIVRSDNAVVPTSIILKATHENGWHGELLNRKKDGTEFPIYLSTSAVRDELGNQIALIGVATDITQSKLVEKRLQEQAALLDITTDAIIVISLQGIVLFWNKGAEKMYGWDSKEVRGKDMRPYIFREYQSVTESSFKDVMQRGEWQGEGTQFTKEGKPITVYSRLVLMKDEQQQPSAILIVCTDISEKKLLESQFLRMQRLESIGTLAGGIAHDLNNVLSPILLSVELLKAKFPGEQTRNILTTLESSANRGKEIIKQVLTFARGISGERFTLQPKHVIKEMEHIIRETFPKTLRLVLDIPTELWTITGDPTQLHQVLLNLCVNARDAMPQGGILSLSAFNVVIDEEFRRTHIEAHPGPFVAFRVTDTGIGIPSELRDIIFDPFFTTKEVGKGTGLGLSTVHAIVKGHNGFVTVQSSVGAGSTFTVYLPSSNTLVTPKPIEPGPEFIHGNGELILVVDDEEAILDIASQTLESSGYRILTAHDGTEAINLYVQHREEIQIVVTDILMPFMDGIALSRSLKQINPDVKIIAASGQETDAQFLLSEGIIVESFLPKPFSADHLVSAINKVLKKIQSLKS